MITFKLTICSKEFNCTIDYNEDSQDVIFDDNNVKLLADNFAKCFTDSINAIVESKIKAMVLNGTLSNLISTKTKPKITRM